MLETCSDFQQAMTVSIRSFSVVMLGLSYFFSFIAALLFLINRSKKLSEYRDKTASPPFPVMVFSLGVGFVGTIIVALLYEYPNGPILIATILFFSLAMLFFLLVSAYRAIREEKMFPHPFSSLVAQTMIVAPLAYIPVNIFSFLSIIMRTPISLTNSFSVALLFYWVLLFPVFFVTLIAWQKDVPLFIKYLFILAYLFVVVIFSGLGLPYFLETHVFEQKFCLGFTCPLTCPESWYR